MMLPLIVFPLYRVLATLVNLYELLLVVWCILSWIPVNEGPVESVRRALGIVVEPVLEVFRRLIPPIGGFDLSPVVAIVVIELIMRVLAFILLR